LDLSLQGRAAKAKINKRDYIKWDFIKLKSLSRAKETHQQNEKGTY